MSIVFFFMQKTAYVMRISDWSSDVCSSDLIDPTNDQTVVREDLQHLTALALVFAGDDDDLVVATNLLHAATPYSTSGASETIFMNFSVRSSRVTGPKIRVPIGSCLLRSEEHTSELQSLMRISYAVFCLKKKTE